MCVKLAQSAPKYALVVSSPLPRAKETAERIAGRLDSIEAGLLPDLGGQAAQLFGEMRTLADWADLMDRDEAARKFADYGAAADALPEIAPVTSKPRPLIALEAGDEGEPDGIQSSAA